MPNATRQRATEEDRRRKRIDDRRRKQRHEAMLLAIKEHAKEVMRGAVVDSLRMIDFTALVRWAVRGCIEDRLKTLDFASHSLDSYLAQQVAQAMLEAFGTASDKMQSRNNGT